MGLSWSVWEGASETWVDGKDSCFLSAHKQKTASSKKRAKKKAFWSHEKQDTGNATACSTYYNCNKNPMVLFLACLCLAQCYNAAKSCAELPNVLCAIFYVWQCVFGWWKGETYHKAIVRANGVKYLTPKQYHSATQMWWFTTWFIFPGLWPGNVKFWLALSAVYHTLSKTTVQDLCLSRFVVVKLGCS